MPIYCELPIWGTMFEPLNSVSNLAFLVAAYFIWRHSSGLPARQRRQQLILAILAALVGIGSFLWHFFRTPWGVAFDVTFINLFLLAFAWFLSTLIFTGRLSQLLAFAGFILVSMFGNTLLRLIDIPYFGTLGGTGYLMPTLFGFFLVPFVWRYSKRVGVYLLITLTIFLLSLLTRQLDVPLCEHTHQHGLHLFWHILNGVVLYRFARTLVDNK